MFRSTADSDGPDGSTPPPQVPGSSAEDQGLGLSVLIADDQPNMRMLLSRLLGHEGCQVTAATNGDEALRLFQEDPDAYDVLLTGVMMPVMTGPELARHVNTDHPDFPIVMMSGHADRPGEEGLAHAFLNKPFRIEALLSALRGAVRGSDASAS